MEGLKKNLNYIGLGLIFLGLAYLRIWPHRKAIPLVLALAGIIAIGVYIFLNLEMLKEGLKRKSFLYSSNLVLIVVLVLGILALINYFSARHHARFDFTESKLHSLSDQSITVLKNLNKEVRIKGFFREDNYNRPRLESLMKIYAYHSKKIKHEFIDPDKNPRLVKSYEVTMDGTTVFECEDRENRVTAASEEDITNALIKITREKKKVIYFLEGHGEASLEETEERGYSLAKEELEKLGYEVKKQSLALAENFPEEASLLVIPGPKKDLLPDERESIEKYIQRGGRVFFLVDPEEASGLKDFLKKFGFKLEEDLIVDRVSRMLGGDYFMPMVSDYESHVITGKFRYATFFPYTRSVDKSESVPEGVSVQILAKSSPSSWAAHHSEERKDYAFDKGRDREGPIPLAAVATVEYRETKKAGEKAPEEEEGKEEAQKQETTQAGNEKLEAKKKKAEGKKEAEDEKEGQAKEIEGRVAVFGDSDFASNTYYNLSGNGNLFLNTVNWLTQEPDLISIQPRTSSPRTIQLSPSQGRLIFFVSLIFLPLAILITGISVWLSRRSK